MKRTLIGFAGRKQSGKSTAAQLLVDNGFVKLSFADTLRDMLRVLLHQMGFSTASIEAMFTTTKEVFIPCLGRTPRQLMQSLGTDWGRDRVIDDLWVQVMRNKLLALGDLDVVIDDVRFDSEACLIRELGGIIISIDRSAPLTAGRYSEDSPDSVPLSEVDGHPSEKPIILEVGDIIIFNDTTREDFLERVAWNVADFRYG